MATNKLRADKQQVCIILPKNQAAIVAATADRSSRSLSNMFAVLVAEALTARGLL